MLINFSGGCTPKIEFLINMGQIIKIFMCLESFFQRKQKTINNFIHNLFVLFFGAQQTHQRHCKRLGSSKNKTK